ncbi:DUF1684 domain-containing protein [Limibacter armeniacum]|uniref:DUF1684 domain-containing protein n=1 Tax=Limibacter armeniacum TaxID=466084 RepID=UPI002FE69C8D
MTKLLTTFLLLLASITALVQQTPEEEIKAFQKHLNEEFANPEESPLTKEDLKSFKELEFFPVDLKYRVKAKLVRTEFTKPFKMATTTDRKPIYRQYGELHFEIDGKLLMLPIYQSYGLMTKEEYKDYLFLPFTDLTNGEESYGGGRFLDLRIPEGNEVTIDFNQAYNPYCAYSGRYSCPIPPKENHLDIAIPVGVKKYKHH